MPAEADGLPRVGPEALNISSVGLDKLDAFIEGEVRSGIAPGAAFAALRGGKIFHERCWGTYCNAQRRDNPMRLDTRHMVYSFSKVVSATMAMIALQEGRIELDRPVAETLPEFGQGGKEKVTLRHCLTHSGGFPEAPAVPVMTEASWDKAVQAVCAAPLQWETGSRTYYHALSAMLIVAELVRRAYGRRSWESLCREYVLDPIGARGLGFEYEPGSALTPQPGEVPLEVNEETMPVIGHPAGGAFSRLEDALRFLLLHLRGGRWGGREILRPDVFGEMHRVQFAEEIQAAKAAGETPAYEYWALGWLTHGDAPPAWFGFGDKSSPRAFGHAGISTFIGIADPDLDLAWVFLTTDSPEKDEDTIRIRNTVSDLIVEAAL